MKAKFCWHLKNKINGNYFALPFGEVEDIDEAMAFPNLDAPLAKQMISEFPDVFVAEKYDLETGKVCE